MQKYSEDKQIAKAKRILIGQGVDKFKTNLYNTDCKTKTVKTEKGVMKDYDITLDYAKQVLIIDTLNSYDEHVKNALKKDANNFMLQQISLTIYTSLCIYRNKIDEVDSRKVDNLYNHFFVQTLKNAIVPTYSAENCVEYKLNEMGDVETKFVSSLCKYNLNKLEVKLGINKDKLIKDFGISTQEIIEEEKEEK